MQKKNAPQKDALLLAKWHKSDAPERSPLIMAFFLPFAIVFKLPKNSAQEAQIVIPQKWAQVCDGP